MKKFLLFVCLLAFIALAYAGCPNNCSGHGNCNGSTCSCSSGWTGQDCSITDILLTSGVMVNGTLHSFEWKYYHINVPSSGTGLKIVVDQTSKYGDVDLYVLLGTYPTTQHYTDKDTSTDKHMELSLENPVPGVYYIGLYGYWQSDFNITATVIYSCLYPCVHGTCVGNTCNCEAPYVNTDAHPDCTTYDMALSNGQQVSGSVATREMKYYHISVPSDQDFSVVVSQNSASGDVDLYLKFGDYPTFYDFDFLNATVGLVSTVNITDPTTGVWYIGVYGYTGDSYTIKASYSQIKGCDNSCSGSTHGTCSGSTCNCLPDYGGDNCNTKNSSISINTNYQGHCDSNSWNYYYLRTSSQNNLIFEMKQDGAGDCDLYLRQNSNPTRLDYDFADLSYGLDFNLTLPSPGVANWYIGIFGWQSCSYTLTYTIDSSCSCIGSHGSCASGSDVCICNQGWAGAGCNIQSYTLTDGEVLVHQNVTENTWKYYEITSMSHILIVTAEETATSGFISLYVSMTGFPTLDAYDFSDTAETNQHEVQIIFDTAVTRRYFIGVYGNAYINSANGVDFSITAWYPPF